MPAFRDVIGRRQNNMDIRITRLALACAILALSACVTAAERATGPMQVSEAVRKGYESWAAMRTPGYFAVTRNGAGYGASYCREMQCDGNAEDLAMSNCRKLVPAETGCVIYAFFGKPVFDGEPFIEHDPGPIEIRTAPAGFTLPKWMEGAFREWSRNPRAASFVVTPSADGHFANYCDGAQCREEADLEALSKCKRFYRLEEDCYVYGRQGRRAL
jgi:hypothetical protein